MSPAEEHILLTMMRDLMKKVDGMEDRLDSVITGIDKRLTLLEKEHKDVQSACQGRKERRLNMRDACFLAVLAFLLGVVAEVAI